MKRLLYISILTLLVLSACHKDKDDSIVPTPDPMPSADDFSVAVTLGADDDGDVIFAARASYERIIVTFTGYDPATDGKILVSTSDTWFTLNTDTLPPDNVVSITTTDNDDRRRTATLNFATTLSSSKTASIPLTQLSPYDSDSNGGDAESVCYIGYGYDIFKAYESPMSVKKTKAIIDLDRLREKTGYLGFDPIQDCSLARTESKYIVSTSIYAFAEELTNSQTKSSVSINGCREDCKTVEKLCSGNIHENNFARGSILKTVASKSMDRGALLDLQAEDEMPWTADFALRVEELIRNSSDKSALLATVNKIINEYGTHIVIQTDLGGRLDYTFSMAKQTSTNSVAELREEIDYTFGRTKRDDRTPEFQSTPSSDKNATSAITIRGGAQTQRDIIKNATNTLSAHAQLNLDDINRWANTINPAPNSEVKITDNLDVVHFELIPIWELLPQQFRDIYLNAVLALVDESDNKFDAEKLHIDIYDIDLTQRELTDFTNDGTLCKILYIDDAPIVQICSEYVPKIRTDRRVTVIYPIHDNKIKMNQGIFIGDGQNQPALVGFSNDYSYVYPIDSLPMDRILKRIYYIGGNLSLKNYGINALKNRTHTVMDDNLILFMDNDDNPLHIHPIVKIGANFWTRHDIDHEMMFTVYDEEDYYEKMYDGVMYVRAQYDNASEFKLYNSWTWGYKPNTFFEGNPNLRWYMPTPAQVQGLYKFLGFNPKALFKGEMSGFNAEFNGYYGQTDVLNGNAYFSDNTNKLRHKGTVSVIPSKSSSNVADACIMVLDKNYNMYLVSDNTTSGSYATTWRKNYYTLRPVRGYMYDYPSLSTIKKHLKP